MDVLMLVDKVSLEYASDMHNRLSRKLAVMDHDGINRYDYGGFYWRVGGYTTSEDWSVKKIKVRKS